MVSSVSSGDSATAQLLQLLQKANGGSSTSATSTTQSDSTSLADQWFQSVDQDGSGTISQSEFSSFASRFSSQTGASLVSAQEGSTDDLFGSLDSDGDGELSQDEIAAMKPPAGAGASTGGGTVAGSASSSASGGSGGSGEQSYDPLDTNKDGVVSPEERMAGMGMQSPTTGNLASNTLGSLLQSIGEVAA